jgi:hypothetical protein
MQGTTADPEPVAGPNQTAEPTPQQAPEPDPEPEPPKRNQVNQIFISADALEMEGREYEQENQRDQPAAFCYEESRCSSAEES